jgi:tRNA(Ile)-lysidine synthase
MGAAEDRTPCVTWPGAEVRRYDGQLHIMPPLPVIDSNTIIPWPDLSKPLPLPDGRTLVCVPTEQRLALSASRLQQGHVTIRYRQRGERLQPANGAHHKSLKQILQEQRIPHWQRDRVPLVYVDEELVAVVGVCLEQTAVQLSAEDAVMIEFES